MPYPQTPRRGTCRSAVALLAPLALFANLPARDVDDDDPAPVAKLDALIVSALQVPRDPSTVTAAVTELDPADLEARGVRQLRDALNESPGVISTSTAGQTGAPSNLFIRGTSTQYAQMVVDGMRLSDSNNQLGHILGGAHVYDIGRIEILRGPQGAIYGGESVGGVVWLETPHGAGAPRGSTTVEAGSFSTLNTYSVYQGERNKLGYFLSGGYQETDNDAPNNHFRQSNTALRLEGNASPKWTLGMTFRANDSDGEDLDTLYSYDSASQVSAALATVYATGRISADWTARFRAGYYQESYDQQYTYDDWMSGLPARASYFSDLQAASFATDHEIRLADNLRWLAGGFIHQDTYESAISADEDGSRYGVHSSLEWDVIAGLTATGSLRWEDYDAFGDELTWRLGVIRTWEASGTTLRGGVGTSFKAPSYMQLFGSSYSPGNPNLDAESATGWDVGIQQEIGAHHRLEITWFENRISDQIDYPVYYAPPVNVDGETTTNGMEIGWRGTFAEPAVSYRLAWTYLHQSLATSGQPRNAATASVDWRPASKAWVGVGATHLSNHSWGGEPLDSYTVARLYGSYQISERVKFHARIENVLDEDYQLYNGYGSFAQGPGTGAYAGLTVEW